MVPLLEQEALVGGVLQQAADEVCHPGDEVADGLSRLGHRVRVYTPIGDLVAGMAYLVRRLLENSSNQGFLLQQRHHSLDDLLEPPG